VDLEVDLEVDWLKVHDVTAGDVVDTELEVDREVVWLKVHDSETVDGELEGVDVVQELYRPHSSPFSPQTNFIMSLMRSLRLT